MTDKLAADELTADKFVAVELTADELVADELVADQEQHGSPTSQSSLIFQQLCVRERLVENPPYPQVGYLSSE